MDDAISIRRKRLKFQSWHRGTKESDLILGRFADHYLETFGESELDAYERLLDCPDPEIFDWISGRAAVPADVESPVTKLLLKFDISAQTIDRY